MREIPREPLKVFTYPELDEKAQERVREWWNRVSWEDGSAVESMDAIWRDSLEADGWADLENLTYSDLYSQGGYPVWNGTREAFEAEGYRWTVTVRAFHRGGYFDTVDVEPECIGDDDPDPTDEDYRLAREAAREYADKLSHDLMWKFRAEDEYIGSDEQVAEACEANEYEFTEDGDLHR